MSKWIAAAVAVLISGATYAQEKTRIVAVVNDHPIAQADLKYRIDMALLSSGMEKTPETVKQLSPEILKMMIDEILQQQLGDKFKIEVSEAEIDHLVQSIEVQNNMEPGGMKKLFESRGIPFDVMRTHLKARQVWHEYIKAKYIDSIAIGKQEVATYMENIKKTKDQPHFLLAEIFIPFGGDITESSALKHTTMLADKIKRGAHFSAVAQEFSRLPSAARGGDMGWVTLDSLDTSLKPVVSSMPLGGLSAPLRVEGGFYLILLRDRRENGKELGKETFLTFRQALFEVDPQGDPAFVEQIFLKAKSFRHQARSCSTAASLLKGNKGIKSQVINKAPASQLPTELRKILLFLEGGGASAPILTPDGFLMLWLCSKEDYNPQDPTEEEVRGLLLERKLSLLAQRELRHLHRGAVITVRHNHSVE